ncbi:hypothetical protein [Streptomyces phaeochromogenes]|nr:hypothetical protein [Streptomyces phaeochromogenes]
MKQLLELLGFLALVQGVAGGYEICVSIALVVLGIALFAAAASRKPG